MDPDATLKIIDGQLASFYALDADAPHFDPAALVEAVAALDDWIKAGGLLPTRWRLARS